MIRGLGLRMKQCWRNMQKSIRKILLILSRLKVFKGKRHFNIVQVEVKSEKMN